MRDFEQLPKDRPTYDVHTDNSAYAELRPVEDSPRITADEIPSDEDQFVVPPDRPGAIGAAEPGDIHQVVGVRQLGSMVNAEARRRYPEIAQKLGATGLIPTISSRVALWRNTEYPYIFREDRALFQEGPRTFGRVIRMDRVAGLQEIHRTIGEQTLEHAWIHVPDLPAWVDVTTAAGRYAVESDSYISTFLSHLFGRIEAVHTHPDRSIAGAANESPSAYSDNYLMEAALPSPNDLQNHLFKVRRGAPDAVISSSIVSHHGVTTFTVNRLATQQDSFFRHGHHDARILDASPDPISAIRRALDQLRHHELLYHGALPTLNFTFEELHA